MTILKYFIGWNKLNINKSDIVLEIGSGGSPYLRSDVLCDKYIEGKEQREGPVIIDRPFVVYDVEKGLPFKDNSFDYIICSHVIEHLDNPDKLIKELMRVAKRGYIEVPNRFMESILGWEFHKWFIEFEESKKLVFYKKDNIDKDKLLFFRKLFNRSNLFKRFINKYYNEFIIRYQWNSKIEYRMANNYQKTINLMLDNRSESKNKVRNKVNSCRIIPNIKKKSKIMLRKLYVLFNKKKQINMRNVLICPKCKNNISIISNKTKAKCYNCNEEYLIEKDIYFMLKDNNG